MSMRPAEFLLTIQRLFGATRAVLTPRWFGARSVLSPQLRQSWSWLGLILCLWHGTFAFGQTSSASPTTNEVLLPEGPCEKSAINLAAIPFKIIHETYRETDGKENWELQLINADGSNPVNLTRTPDVDELYPHASPDGTKICFVAEEKKGSRRIRSAYYMNIDGTGRVLIAENAREAFWSSDGKVIAYTKCEYDRYSLRPFASKGLFYYEVTTATHRPHPNANLHHLYNVSWSPDGKSQACSDPLAPAD
jgi:Tol biopolymer transport system component